MYDKKSTMFTNYRSLQHLLDQKELSTRQRRWLKLPSDYDCEIRYHLGKVNVVADALSIKEQAKPPKERALMLDVFKDEGRLSEAIRFTGTTRNTLLEMGKYSHRFYHKPAEDNKLLLHDLGNRDHQKNYTNVRRKPLEFQVEDKVMLKIIAKVGIVAYHLKLPEQLSRVHSTFHVSNLKKCLSDETIAIPLDKIQIDDKLHFIEELVEIIDHEVKHLKQSRIPIVKVHWNFRRGPKFTWEREDQM
ncbi:hypothetical protein Tco_0414220 [Tanacetum coccineum]